MSVPGSCILKVVDVARANNWNYSVFQDDGQQRPLRDAWFSVGMTDKAAFMAVLSNSALHINSSQRGGQIAEETAAAVKYQTEAVAIVNKRLQNWSLQQNVELWDATIGAVSGLVCNAVRYPLGATMADLHLNIDIEICVLDKGTMFLILVIRISEAHGKTGILTYEACSNSSSFAAGSRSSTPT